MTAGELAGRLGLGAPATTALVDRLESAGHVRRDRDPHDRRKVTIVDAAAGAGAGDGVLRAARPADEPGALEGTSPEEMRRATADRAPR